MKNTKGQATIEFLLILVVVLMYITTIIQPAADSSATSIEDTANLAKVRLSAEKIADTMEYVYLSGTGTRQTIIVARPNGAEITCDTTTANAKIKMSYIPNSTSKVKACELDDDAPADSSKCTKIIETNVPAANSGCGLFPSLAEGDTSDIIIEKLATGNLTIINV